MILKAASLPFLSPLVWQHYPVYLHLIGAAVFQIYHHFYPFLGGRGREFVRVDLSNITRGELVAMGKIYNRANPPNIISNLFARNS